MNPDLSEPGPPTPSSTSAVLREPNPNAAHGMYSDDAPIPLDLLPDGTAARLYRHVRTLELHDDPERECRRTNGSLTDALGIARSTLFRALRACRDTGWLDRDHRGDLRARPVPPGALQVCPPDHVVYAITDPTVFATYCAVMSLHDRGLDPTAQRLSEILGCSVKAAHRRLTRAHLTGWITIHRRAGRRGRNLIDLHVRRVHCRLPGSGDKFLASSDYGNPLSLVGSYSRVNLRDAG